MNFRYKVYFIPGYNFGYIWMNVGYFGDFFSGILVYHYPPWPTLIYIILVAYKSIIEAEGGLRRLFSVITVI